MSIEMVAEITQIRETNERGKREENRREIDKAGQDNMKDGKM